MSTPRQLARKHLGYDKLRPDQAAVLKHIKAGDDVLAIIPTGGGKSAIYQIAGLMLDGPSIVISPLIALQSDQVAHIEDVDLPQAAVLNSHIGVADKRDIWADYDADELEYLLLAPEQIVGGETLAKLEENPPSLIVLDEAHCVSEWGHDFRPAYRQLGKVIARLRKAAKKLGRPEPRLLALTATAAPEVRDDILTQLGLAKAATYIAGFDRPNIDLRVDECPDVSTKNRLLPVRIREIAEQLGSTDAGKCCGIVYVATRANTDEVAELLAENNLAATTYHGGMTKAERTQRMAQFMDGSVRIMVATSAFGMGVDKPDVRWVIHYDVPDSLDNYYQQVGRAGRDGEPAVGLLLYREADLGLQRTLSAPARLDADEVAEVIELVRKQKRIDTDAIAEATDVTNGRLARTLQLLEANDAVIVRLNGEVRARKNEAEPKELAEDVLADQQRFRAWRERRLERMQAFAETSACRRALLLRYFGDAPQSEVCNTCDNCRSGTSREFADDSVDEEYPFPLHGEVEHKKFGLGIVQGYEGDKIEVLFRAEGTKKLVLDTVVEHQLLAVVE